MKDLGRLLLNWRFCFGGTAFFCFCLSGIDLRLGVFCFLTIELLLPHSVDSVQLVPIIILQVVPSLCSDATIESADCIRIQVSRAYTLTDMPFFVLAYDGSTRVRDLYPRCDTGIHEKRRVDDSTEDIVVLGNAEHVLAYARAHLNALYVSALTIVDQDCVMIECLRQCVHALEKKSVLVLMLIC